MRIWFHGTNNENAEKILKSGFSKDTWFARHLEDAIEFGGNHIFEVAVDFKKDDWQVLSANKIPADRIVRHRVINEKTIFEDNELRDKIYDQ